MMEKFRKIQKILVANRGEIAVRVIRACRELGIQSVAVYSDVDRNSLHVRMADHAYALHGSLAAETYLNQDKLLRVAVESQADAVHPGYGFLSENSAFVEQLERADIIFVGPTSSAIRVLGDKTEARKLASKLGVPSVEGTLKPLDSVRDAMRYAEQVGFPILLKAAAGGGGKGMRLVATMQELPSLLKSAKSEAKSAFGDDRVYIEKYLVNARHIEIQILADEQGNTTYLGERECSIQRRHQKIIEESPSTAIDEVIRKKMGEAAVTLTKAGGYSNAGTVEFLVDQSRSFYFLEMNTRLQVEHPVTELVTGIDIVKEQISVAAGNPLSCSQEDIVFRGHAIECRIYAEDPTNGFFPSTGFLRHYSVPQGPRLRADNGFEEGNEVSVYYDPMLSKIITWGMTRGEALDAMKRGLQEFEIQGVSSTISFCLFVLNHPKFIQGDFNTMFVEDFFDPKVLGSADPAEMKAAATVAALMRSQNTRYTEHPHFATDGSRWKKLRTETYRS
ncbi:MAG TPA: acetyl-CoA carboxylase biotin carboxylase subunit [Bacteroidota bacterium]|nr:acetyl-CoA carboxylase biotin carboxylase subunit [Bacteroidota bacterium]